jgi:ferrous iron transport protein B
VSKRAFTIALVGNPNSGKSSVFNQLTGLRQKVGNFPGVTVDKKVGKLKLAPGKDAILLDFPGTYSLYPTSMDERVVLDVFTNPDDPNYPDAVLYLADITNLEKHFLLLTQMKDLGLPMVLALNMSDLAEKQELIIDDQKLSDFLKMPVVVISGRSGHNLENLRKVLADIFKTQQNKSAKSNKQVQNFYPFSKTEKDVIEKIKIQFPLKNDYQALLWAHHSKRLMFMGQTQKETIQKIVEKTEFHSIAKQINETMQRFNKFTPVLQKIIKKPQTQPVSITDKIDRLVVHPIAGPIIFFGLMFLVFQAIFAWAQYPMGWIEAGFGALTEFTKSTLPAGWFTDLLTEGIIAGLGGILIFVPQITILFFLIAVLEEVGYMARAVFMFDKVMQKFGLNGRSVVALISSSACAIPAIMSTRTISNWKERLITILVTPLISCSARIPVYAILIGFVVPSVTVLGIFNAQGLAFMGLYLLGIVAALASGWVFKKILKSEESSFLMLELPQYRQPVWKNIWFTLKSKVTSFVVEAGKVIMVISVVLWFLASYGPTEKMAQAEATAIEMAKSQNLSEDKTADLIAGQQIEASYAGHLGKFIEPAIRPLGYDWKIGIALITSFAAREVFVGTMATIYSIGSVEDETTIRDQLSKARNPITGAPVYTMATSLSLLIFYVFALQCMSTLAVVRRETGSWKWPIIQFLFMGGLAYVGALITFQLFK